MMTSKKQSPQQSQTSSSSSPPRPQEQSTPRVVIVSNVPLDIDQTKLLQDLGHNYTSIDKVSRLHDKDGKPINSVRIEFKSDKAAMDILKHGYILINGQRRPARAYSPLVCRRCNKEGHYASECPQKPLTEQHLMKMFQQQQMQLEAMINAFETKWNARLSSLSVSSSINNNNNNVDQQLLPVLREVTTVCQQFNQQNVQMQQQLGAVVNRIQNVQKTLTSGQNQLPYQNGH